MIAPSKSKTDIQHFLKLASSLPVADVRTPSEFMSGHIPGAFNIPLFSDAERERVGIIYKKEGRINAIREGLRLAGPGLAEKLEKAIDLAAGGRLLVHCWRGGMRSEAMAWLFSLGGVDCEILEGGYKSYRHHVLESLSAHRKIYILGGLTGSGKTELLHYLKRSGQQVIDLEGLANHKGSAFGALGQEAQPSSEHFANMLFSEWEKTDPSLPVWIEDESRNIGSVFMPDAFYGKLQENPAIILMMDIETRLPRLMNEYSRYNKSDLRTCVMKISKRLGGDNTREALEAIESGDLSRTAEITLRYYDKAYLYGLKKKKEQNIIYVSSDTDDVALNAARVLEAAEKINRLRQL